MEPDRLRRSVPLVLAWLLAAAAALAVASWGVALVGNSVTDRRPAPLTAAQVDDRLDELATSTSTSSSSVPPSSVPGSGDQASSTSSTPDTPGPVGSTTTTAPPTATTVASSSATTSAPAAPSTTAAPAETRTYALQGGTATLRFEPGRVTVVFANPAQGFEVEVEPEHVNGVKVEFESQTHRSRVDGWWDGGPQDRVSERDDDSGGDDSD